MVSVFPLVNLIYVAYVFFITVCLLVQTLCQAFPGHLVFKHPYTRWSPSCWFSFCKKYIWDIWNWSLNLFFYCYQSHFMLPSFCTVILYRRCERTIVRSQRWKSWGKLFCDPLFVLAAVLIDRRRRGCALRAGWYFPCVLSLSAVHRPDEHGCLHRAYRSYVDTEKWFCAREDCWQRYFYTNEDLFMNEDVDLS